MAKDYYLVHHGILGQKWGVRRFQNEDGSYTEEGKRRRRDGEEISIGNKTISKSAIKKVAIGAAALGTVAAAALYVKKNPEVIAKVIKKASNTPLKKIKKEDVDKGKAIFDTIKKQVMDGVKEGLKQAPYQVGKVVAQGAGIMAANKVVDKLIGKKNNETLVKAYNAYNKKNKVGQVPRKLESGKEDED